MVELIFVAVSIVSLFLLLKSAGSGRSQKQKILTLMIGVLFITLPGIITFASLWSDDEPFEGTDHILVPAGDSHDNIDAPYYLVRGFMTYDQDHVYPVDFFQAVCEKNYKHSLDLKDNAEFSLNISKQRTDNRVLFKFTLDSSGKMSGEGAITKRSVISLEDGYPLYRKTYKIRYLDRAGFGSLLADAGRPFILNLMITPLSNRDAVDMVPTMEWRAKYTDRIVSMIKAKPEREEQLSASSYSSGFTIGGEDFISNSAYLFLLAGLCFILHSAFHRVRCFFLYIIFVIIYVSAMDSIALRVHRARISDKDPYTASLAARDLCSSRMHKISAASALLETSKSHPDSDVRIKSLTFIKGDLRLAVKNSEKNMNLLQDLASSADQEIATAANRILDALD